MKLLTVVATIHSLLGCAIMGHTALNGAPFVAKLCFAPIVAALTLAPLLEIRAHQNRQQFWAACGFQN